MKSVVKSPQAEIDIFNAAQYYEGEQLDLGVRYIRTVRTAFEKISTAPSAGSTRYAHLLPNVRMHVIREFPFLVFYVEHDAYIDVIRVLHAHRDLPIVLQDSE